MRGPDSPLRCPVMIINMHADLMVPVELQHAQWLLTV